MSNLHIRDALDGASTGSLIRSTDTSEIHDALVALVGEVAASHVLDWAGTVGLRRMTAAELVEVCGISREAAATIVAARALHQALGQQRLPSVTRMQHVIDALPRGFGSFETEVILCCALNVRNALIGTFVLSQGGRHGASITAKDVFVPLVRLGASAFVLVHNHPSGTVDPSREDLALTNTVARLGRELGIRLLDHVIVGEQDALSLVDIGLLPEDGEVRDGQ